MKYAACIAIMMLVGNEIFSLLCLMLIAGFFWTDVARARFNG